MGLLLYLLCLLAVFTSQQCAAGHASSIIALASDFVLVATSFRVARSDVFYVTPGNQSLCPANATQCHTLDFALNSSFVPDNSEVRFLEGNFTLNSSVVFNGSHNISLVGAGSGLSRPSTWITCKQATSQQDRGGFVFLNSTEISITRLGFDSCGADVDVCQERLANISATIYFRQGCNISLHQVTVTNARGIGLGLDNVFGSVSVYESTFMRASLVRKNMLPGNCRIWFGPNNCLKQCPASKSAVTIRSSDFVDGQYNANGLEIIIHCPNVQIVMDNLTIANNRGRKGGNLALSVTDFDNSTNTNIVNITNSRIFGGNAEKGGGMIFWTRTLLTPRSSCMNSVHNVLEVSNTVFSLNHARLKGGGLMMSHYQGSGYSCNTKRVLFKSCTFEGNSGDAAAMFISRHLILAEHASPHLNLSFENCEFCNNFAPNISKGTIASVFMSHISIRNCSFHENNGTAISLQGSYMNVHGRNVFEGNRAVYGAALKVCDQSLIFLKANSNLHFVNNAASMGGAVFVQNNCLETSPPCTFQPALYEDVDVEDFNKHLSLEFVNNSATVAGDALYGESVHSCYTIEKYKYPNQTNWRYQHIFEQIFKMDDQKGPSNVSSDPMGVCFCSNSGTPTCHMDYQMINVFPGEKFNISAVVVGQQNGTTSGVILSSQDVNDSHRYRLISINNGNVSNHCVNLTYTILSTTNQTQSEAIILLRPLTKYGRRNFAAKLIVKLRSCPLGFQLVRRDEGYKCDCDKLFNATFGKKGAKFVCDINTRTVHLKWGQWIGCYPSDAHCDSLALSSSCVYCPQKDHAVTIKKFIMDVDQCDRYMYGRTGLLCGKCKHGFSHRLGLKTNCRSCSNKSTLLYLLAFSLSGVGMVCLLTLLNITVTSGTLYGLIFYATVLFGNQAFFPTDTALSNFLWTFIAALNLEPSRAGCAYHGMTGYQYIWLKLLYVLNFLIVQAVVIFLSRKFMFFTRLFGKDVLKVLATLLFLGHSQLLFACLHTFAYSTIFVSASNGTERIVRWRVDGNLPYFGLKHAILFLVAFICSVLSLLFMFSLFFIQCLQRMSGRWYLRWVDRLRPFYEVFTGPCNDNYRFWPGMMYLLRSGLFATSIYIDSRSEEFIHFKMLTTAAICLLVMCLGCMLPRGIYKKWLLNVLEFSILLNLTITCIFLAYLRHYRNVITISTLPVVLTFCGIFLYHVYLRLRGTILWKPFAKAHYICIKKYRKWRSSRSNDDDDDELLLPQPPSDDDQFSYSREPLLDD